MFALPLTAPVHDLTAYLPHHSTSHIAPPLDNSAPDANHTRRAAPTHASPLALLKAEEAAILRRKENIARFGSTWIRPPGVAKTLQAETEERLEREEQEALARREQMMLDLQARQEQEEARARAAEAGDQTEEVERDLDDDVAEGMEGVSEDEDEESDEVTLSGEIEEDDDEERDLDDDVPDADDDEEAEGDVSFNEASLVEGSMLDRTGEDEGNAERVIQERYAQIQEAELTGVVQEEEELGMQGDLDDSVPEAGSYEHTDTELEDDTSELGASFSAATSGLGVQRSDSQRRGGLFDNARRSAGGRASGGSAGSRGSLGARDIGSLLDSSFVTSSPVVGRLRSGQQRGGGSR